MTKLRKSNFLYLAFPLITWVSGCGSDDDTSGTPSAGASSGGRSGAPGAAGKAGAPETAGSGEQAGAAATGAGGQAGSGEVSAGSAGEAGASGPADVVALSDVQTVVVIFAENRTFDGMFGNFPGAHGYSEVMNADGTPNANYVAQKDRDGSVLAKLPKTWGGATLPGNLTTVTQAQTDNLPNAPFSIETAFVSNGAPTLTTLDVTIDLTHRFFENQMEINGGTSDLFAAWLDGGGLTMGHWDTSQNGLYKLAQQYVLADNFFSGAFGGSFLNHQYLVCACAPSVPTSFVTANSPSVNVLGASNAKGVPQLATVSTSPASALDGPPSFMKSGAIAPLDYFGVGDGYRAVNTIQAPYQPSGNPPAVGATGDDLKYANPQNGSTLPPLSETTIGDLLTAKGVSWTWYASSWDAAVADGTQVSTTTRTVIYNPSGPRSAPDFQPHHQPFNYYSAFDPLTHAAERVTHLKDYNALVSDIQKGTLPSVVYYKPTGNLNQHPGYANIDDGDQHITSLVNQLKAGAQWDHMVIVITYDEYGGQWDHISPPKGDLIGPGSRIPAIIVSPYAKKGTVDHTQYDTGSIARLVTRRFGLTALSGISARDAALLANSKPKMGDLTAALNVQ